jgi:hypothetical protein
MTGSGMTRVLPPRPLPLIRPLRGGMVRALLLSALILLPGPARAAEPVLTVLKNTLLGGVTGLLLGGTVSLVTDKDHRGDVVRWGFVLGTLGGFVLGVSLAARGEEGLFLSGPAGPIPPRPRARATAFRPPQPVGSVMTWGLGLVAPAPAGR